MRTRVLPEGTRPWVALLLGLTLAAGMTGIDLAAGGDASFLIFYLAPVLVTAWMGGLPAGVAVSAAGVAAWSLLHGESQQPAFVFLAMTAARLLTFVLLAAIVSRLKAALELEKRLSRTDELTGSANRRAFVESLRMEIERSHRYGSPYSLAYIDVDDFKAINDRMGHRIGDMLLRLIGETLRRNLRATDTVARLGGDEFALLLPETGYEAAETLVAKLQPILVERVRARHWPVSFSIGVVTCEGCRVSPEEVLNAADTLMYAVKNSGKDNVLHRSLDMLGEELRESA